MSFFILPAAAGLQDFEILTSPDAFVVPTGVFTLSLAMFNSGGAADTGINQFGGGGGGMAVRNSVAVTPGETLSGQTSLVNVGGVNYVLWRWGRNIGGGGEEVMVSAYAGNAGEGDGSGSQGAPTTGAGGGGFTAGGQGGGGNGVGGTGAGPAGTSPGNVTNNTHGYGTVLGDGSWSRVHQDGYGKGHGDGGVQGPSGQDGRALLVIWGPGNGIDTTGADTTYWAG